MADRHLALVTKGRKNTPDPFIPDLDKLLLRKRALIETVIYQLKNISQIEHIRLSSFYNCLGNIIAGIIAYTWLPTKPSLGLRASAVAFPDLVL